MSETKIETKLAAIVRDRLDDLECHEKTKKQAASDKRRDRELQAAGYQVFRYTGSEIFRNEDELLKDLRGGIDLFIEVLWGVPGALKGVTR